MAERIALHCGQSGSWRAGFNADHSGGQTLLSTTGASSQAVPGVTLYDAYLVRPLPDGLASRWACRASPTSLPAVVTTDLRLNEPRDVTLPNIMKCTSPRCRRCSHRPNARTPGAWHCAARGDVQRAQVAEGRGHDRAKVLAEIYLPLKAAHIGLVSASALLFALRGAAVLARQFRAMTKPWWMLSCGIDTLLLTAGAALQTMLSLNSARNPWLGTKLLLLAVYVGLCSLALKRARTPKARRLSYAGALVVYLFMASVAVAHDPLGPLRICGGCMAAD